MHSIDDGHVTTGLVANATAGAWDLAIDQAIDGPDRWFVQIEGPSIYLYFEIAHPRIVREAICFIDGRRSGAANRTDGCTVGSGGELALGHLAQLPVNLVWDEEYADRLFLTVGNSGNACIRCSVLGPDLDRLVDGLRQVVENLG